MLFNALYTSRLPGTSNIGKLLRRLETWTKPLGSGIKTDNSLIFFSHFLQTAPLVSLRSSPVYWEGGKNGTPHMSREGWLPQAKDNLVQITG